MLSFEQSNYSNLAYPTEKTDLIVDDTAEVFVGRRAQNAENVVQLIEIMFAGEDGPIRQHLREDATHRPDVDGLGVALQKSKTYVEGLSKTEMSTQVCLRLRESKVFFVPLHHQKF